MSRIWTILCGRRVLSTGQVFSSWFRIKLETHINHDINWLTMSASSCEPKSSIRLCKKNPHAQAKEWISSRIKMVTIQGPSPSEWMLRMLEKLSYLSAIVDLLVLASLFSALSSRFSALYSLTLFIPQHHLHSSHFSALAAHISALASIFSALASPSQHLFHTSEIDPFSSQLLFLSPKKCCFSHLLSCWVWSRAVTPFFAEFA
jgi:hypothetical protein